MIFSIQNLNNVIFLNKKNHAFEIKPSPLCSFFCNLYDETLYAIFYECDHVKCLWFDLVQCFQNNLITSTLIQQTTIFAFLLFANNNSIFENNKFLSNHLLLIFKSYMYKSREKRLININNLIAETGKVKRIEKDIALTNSEKTVAFTK